MSALSHSSNVSAFTFTQVWRYELYLVMSSAYIIGMVIGMSFCEIVMIFTSANTLLITWNGFANAVLAYVICPWLSHLFLTQPSNFFTPLSFLISVLFLDGRPVLVLNISVIVARSTFSKPSTNDDGSGK